MRVFSGKRSERPSVSAFSHSSGKTVISPEKHCPDFLQLALFIKEYAQEFMGEPGDHQGKVGRVGEAVLDCRSEAVSGDVVPSQR